jgi:hypothetical protein
MISVALCSNWAFAQQSQASSCASIEGTFLVRGQSDEGATPTRQIYYLDQASGGLSQKQGHYFSFKLTDAPATIEAVLFQADGTRLFSHAMPSPFVCKGGTFSREASVSGGGEGCSKVGQVKTVVSLEKDGSLIFKTEERWEFGVMCFTKPREIVRLLKYPAFEVQK